jgi:transposase
LAPGNISGGKILSSKSRCFSSTVAAPLRLVAVATGQTDTAPGGFYCRLLARIRNAEGATDRKIAALFCITLRYGMEYGNHCAAYCDERDRQRVLNKLTRYVESRNHVSSSELVQWLGLSGHQDTQITKMEEPVVFRASRS